MPRVQDRGQVVIPARVRSEVGLAPGDEVVVEAQGDQVIVRKRRGILEYVEETGGLKTPAPQRGKSDKQIRRSAIEWHVSQRRDDR